MFMEDDIAKLFTICYTRHSDTGLFLPLQFAGGNQNTIMQFMYSPLFQMCLWERTWQHSLSQVMGITPVIIWARISKLWYKTGVKTTQVHAVRGRIRHLWDSKCRSLQVRLFVVTPFTHSSSQHPPLPLLAFPWIEVLWQLSSALHYGISDYPLHQRRAMWADSVPGSMGLETMQFSLHGAGSYGFSSLHQCIHGSLHYILTVFLGCPECFLHMKMLSEPAKARTSPMKFAVSLQALNLELLFHCLLGLELCPSR